MGRKQREILAWIGRLAVSGQVPEDRGRQCEVLVEAGFLLADIEAALDSVSADGVVDLGPGGLDGPADLSNLTSNATRFLNALRDVGYLDDALEDEVLDLVMATPGGEVSLDAIRHHVAAVLFDRQQELDHETLRLLQEEWRLVFH